MPKKPYVSPPFHVSTESQTNSHTVTPERTFGGEFENSEELAASLGKKRREAKLRGKRREAEKRERETSAKRERERETRRGALGGCWAYLLDLLEGLVGIGPAGPDEEVGLVPPLRLRLGGVLELLEDEVAIIAALGRASR